MSSVQLLPEGLMEPIREQLRKGTVLPRGGPALLLYFNTLIVLPIQYKGLHVSIDRKTHKQETSSRTEGLPKGNYKTWTFYFGPPSEPPFAPHSDPYFIHVSIYIYFFIYMLVIRNCVTF